MAKVSFAKDPKSDNATQPVVDVVQKEAEVAVTPAATTPNGVVHDVEVVAAPAQPSAAPAQVPATPVAAPAPPLPVTVPRSPGAFSDSADDIDFDQIKLPVLKIVQGVGPLAEAFTPGDVVVAAAGDVVFPVAYAPPKPVAPGSKAPPEKPQTPVDLIILAMRRNDRYTEKTEQGSDDRGRLFQTEKEVFDAGGTTNYDQARETGKPLFRALSTVLALVGKPADIEDDTGLFSVIVGGRPYALVLWHLVGSGHTNAAKPLKTARKFTYLRSGWSSRKVTLATVFKRWDANRSGFIPQVRPGAELTPGEAADVADTLAGATGK